jgi:hypothetical protein
VVAVVGEAEPAVKSGELPVVLPSEQAVAEVLVPPFTPLQPQVQPEAFSTLLTEVPAEQL